MCGGGGGKEVGVLHIGCRVYCMLIGLRDVWGEMLRSSDFNVQIIKNVLLRDVT